MIKTNYGNVTTYVSNISSDKVAVYHKGYLQDFEIVTYSQNFKTVEAMQDYIEKLTNVCQDLINNKVEEVAKQELEKTNITLETIEQGKRIQKLGTKPFIMQGYLNLEGGSMVMYSIIENKDGDDDDIEAPIFYTFHRREEVLFTGDLADTKAFALEYFKAI